MNAELAARCAITPDLSPLQRSVLSVLCLYAWHDGTHADVGVSTIIAHTGLPRRSVYFALEELRRGGWFWDQPPPKWGGKYTGRTINIAKLATLPESNAAKARRTKPCSGLHTSEPVDNYKPCNEAPETVQRSPQNHAVGCTIERALEPSKEKTRDSAGALTRAFEESPTRKPEPEPPDDDRLNAEYEVLWAMYPPRGMGDKQAADDHRRGKWAYKHQRKAGQRSCAEIRAKVAEYSAKCVRTGIRGTRYVAELRTFLMVRLDQPAEKPAEQPQQQQPDAMDEGVRRERAVDAAITDEQREASELRAKDLVRQERERLRAIVGRPAVEPEPEPSVIEADEPAPPPRNDPPTDAGMAQAVHLLAAQFTGVQQKRKRPAQSAQPKPRPRERPKQRSVDEQLAHAKTFMKPDDYAELEKALRDRATMTKAA